MVFSHTNTFLVMQIHHEKNPRASKLLGKPEKRIRRLATFFNALLGTDTSEILVWLLGSTVRPNPIVNEA